MSPLSRMRKSRDHWKNIAGERAETLREMRKKEKRQQKRITTLSGRLSAVRRGLANLKKKIH